MNFRTCHTYHTISAYTMAITDLEGKRLMFLISNKIIFYDGLPSPNPFLQIYPRKDIQGDNRSCSISHIMILKVACISNFGNTRPNYDHISTENSESHKSDKISSKGKVDNVHTNKDHGISATNVKKDLKVNISLRKPSTKKSFQETG